MGTYDLRLQLAQIAERDGRRSDAACLYVQVLWGDPAMVQAWWGLGQTVDDPAQARACLKRVLDLAPYHVEARQRLAELDLEDKPELDTIA